MGSTGSGTTFYATGTMVCASLFNQAAPAPCVRLHLGSHYDIVDEMLRRWMAAGLHYDQPTLLPGEAALGHPLPRQELRRQHEPRLDSPVRRRRWTVRVS